MAHTNNPEPENNLWMGGLLVESTTEKQILDAVYLGHRPKARRFFLKPLPFRIKCRYRTVFTSRRPINAIGFPGSWIGKRE